MVLTVHCVCVSHKMSVMVFMVLGVAPPRRSGQCSAAARNRIVCIMLTLGPEEMLNPSIVLHCTAGSPEIGKSIPFHKTVVEVYWNISIQNSSSN